MPLCVAVFAPCGLLLPLLFPLTPIPFFVCRAFAVRRGYPASPVIYFIFLFHFLIYFISHLRPPVVVAFGFGGSCFPVLCCAGPISCSYPRGFWFESHRGPLFFGQTSGFSIFSVSDRMCGIFFLCSAQIFALGHRTPKTFNSPLDSHPPAALGFSRTVVIFAASLLTP
jgi:hypothetical protein